MNDGEWELVLFTDSIGNVLGYAVYRLNGGAYCAGEEVIELRQFFIDRPLRRRGLGKAAYKILVEERFKGREVSVDVLATNPGGRRFWETLGFREHYVSMSCSGDSR